MASGFPGGGAEFYGGGRPMSTNASQPQYRSQLAGIFLDQSGQISGRTVGAKRSLADFQAQQQFSNPVRNIPFLRSVKPRTFPHAAPLLSSLSHMPSDLSFLSTSSVPSQRFGVPVAQVRPQPMNSRFAFQMNIPNERQGQPQLGGSMTFPNQVRSNHDADNMMTRLKELEKVLLDDDEEDAASVITNTNSEWSETIQNLVSTVPVQSPTQHPLTSSSPSSSSSSCSSAASPVFACSSQTVMEAANAISDGKTDTAFEIISRASQGLNPKVCSEQKVLESVLAGLKLRLNPIDTPQPNFEPYGEEHSNSTQQLYDLSPCFKLGFMAANLAILEAILDPNGYNAVFHVIDFDIGQGGQYKNLLHELKARKPMSPRAVKITALTDGVEARALEVGEELTEMGESYGVHIDFKVLRTPRLIDLSRESLGCEADETIAVNLAFKLYRIADESVSTENPRDELLRRVKSLAPRVVTLVEQEMNGNTAPFVARVGETCRYYGSLLESIDATVPRENSKRVKVEEGVGRRIVNTVAREGADRVERCEVFGKWRARMSMAGFELMPLSQRIAESIRTRLSNGRPVNPGFTVSEDNGGVCFGWKGRTLTVASSWR